MLSKVDTEKTEVELLADRLWHPCVRDPGPPEDLVEKPPPLLTPCGYEPELRRSRVIRVGPVTCAGCRAALKAADYLVDF